MSRSLEHIYNEYCGVQSEVSALDEGRPLYNELSDKRDTLWDEYLAGGGSRMPWHDVDPEAGRTDNFEPISGGYHGPLLKQLRERLQLPTRQRASGFTYTDRKAVEAFQAGHNFPVTGKVDRDTWSALCDELGEEDTRDEEQRETDAHEIAVSHLGAPACVMPIVLHSKQLWQFALDDVPERTFANQFNLGLLSNLVYDKLQDTERQLEPLFANYQFAHHLAIEMQVGASYRPWLRSTTSPYRVRSLSKSETDTELVLLGNREHLIIAVRGTETDNLAGIRDDLFTTDLDAQRAAWPHGGQPSSVHRGFFKAFESIREELVEKIEELRAKTMGPTPIFITGHSLGGAVANLIACYLRSSPRFSAHPVQLYTFGQPRVGNRAFAEQAWLHDPDFTYFRTAHLLDPVPMVPSPYLVDDLGSTIDTWLEAMRAFGQEVLRAAQQQHDPLTYLILQRMGVPEPSPELSDDERRWVREQLAKKCDPNVDFRHFGVPIWCGSTTDQHPYMYEVPQGFDARIIETEAEVKLHSIHDAKLAMHNMAGSYLGQMLQHFRQDFEFYLKGTGTAPPLSNPWLPAREVQHMYRFYARHGELAGYFTFDTLQKVSTQADQGPNP